MHEKYRGKEIFLMKCLAWKSELLLTREVRSPIVPKFWIEFKKSDQLLFTIKAFFRVFSVSYRTCNLDSSILIVYFCKNHHLKLNEIFSVIIKFCYNVILYCYLLIISFLHNLIVDGKAFKVNLKWIIDFDERNHEKIIFIHCPNLALIKKCMFWRIHINFMQKKYVIVIHNGDNLKTIN